MKGHEIYTEAAKRIVSGSNIYTCVAIREAMKCRAWDFKYVGFYRNWFMPPLGESVDWWNYINFDVHKYQLPRSLALLFMAEIAKEENL